jgi:hypothetical protein
MARRAQGGDIGAQLGYYLLASGAASAVVMGCIEGWRGAFDAHREWMLRMLFKAVPVPHSKLFLQVRGFITGHLSPHTPQQ